MKKFIQNFKKSLEGMADLFVVKKEQTINGNEYVVVNATKQEYASDFYSSFQMAMNKCAKLQEQANSKVSEDKRWA